MKRSLFLPCLTVDDDGNIDIDFGQSYDNTELDNGELTYNEPDGNPHSALLDRILGPDDLTTARRLRRLAAYMEERIQPRDGSRKRCSKCGEWVRWDENRWADDEDFDHLCGTEPDGTTTPAVP